MRVFSDRVQDAVQRSASVLVAGLDPDIESFPQEFLTHAAKSTKNDEEFFYRAIVSFYQAALERIAKQVAAVKPNLAFYEQYGIGGLRAYGDICAWCRDNGILVIADAKRGDIGSTATAYANAFLGNRISAGRPVTALCADALTVNPFLGFDTLEPFISRAEQHGCGIFILVRTSNPGAKDLQGELSVRIAEWIENNSARLQGQSQLSGLGAVVGATYADDLLRMRKIMPHSIFLVPGYGAQGGMPSDISQARSSHGNAILVNSSRGIFANIRAEANVTETLTIIEQRVQQSNNALSCVR